MFETPERDWWRVLYFAAVQMVRNGTVAGYMTQVTLLQYLVNQQPCDMAIVESGWGYGEQVPAVSRPLQVIKNEYAVCPSALMM